MTEPSAPVPPRRRRRRTIAAIVGLPLACLVWANQIEPRWLETTGHAFGEGSTVVRIVHLTDLHVTSLGRGDRLRVTEAVAALRPDLIAITGDTVTAPLDPGEAEAGRELIASLSAPLGVFACLGNHESWSDPTPLDVYEQAILVGQRSRTLLGGRLVLHGIDDLDAPFPAQDGPGYDVLLSHYPAVLPRAALSGFQLVLAGHSHGGQVRLPFLGPLWLPFGCEGYDQGWFEQDATRMYVSRGVGTSILPLRFLCRPEVALIELRLP